MSAIKIYCNLRPEPGKPAFVQSATSAAGFVFSQFMRDMQVPLQIYGLLPNPTGGRVAPFTAQTMSDYECWVGVGGYHTPLTTGTFVWNAGGYFEGVLDFKTTEMRTALGAATSATVINKIFEARFSKGSTEDIILQQAVRIGNVVKDEDAGDASSVSDTIFAERMETALQDTNSIAWTRDGIHITGDVRRKTAGGISEDSDGLFISAPMPTLHVSMTAVMGFTASPTVATDAATVQGQAGTRYRLKIGVAASVELSAYTGGTNHAGDDSHFLRGGTPPANNYNRLTLEVSSPAQTYVLNKGTSAIIETLAYEADIDADAGATLTLKLDSVDGLMLSPTQDCTVTLERVAVLPIDTTQADALLGITGNIQTRLSTVEVAVEGHTQYVLTASTTDATPTELLIGGTTRLVLPDNTTWHFVAQLLGRYRDGDAGATFAAPDTGIGGVASCLAMSANGKFQFAGINSGSLYRSLDYGKTWSAISGTSPNYWTAIACSTDGTNVVAVATGARIYTSTDSGATWTQRDSVRQWTSVAISSDGTKLVASVNPGYLYTSTDSGVTWTQRAASRNWKSVASSANGTKLLAAVDGGYLYTSTDSGVTWTQRDSSRSWVGVASSADGVKLYASDNDTSKVYRSSDSGATWTGVDAGIGTFAGQIGCSTDGAVVIASGSGVALRRSNDSGATWASIGSSLDYKGVACSATATRITASTDVGLRISGEIAGAGGATITGLATRVSGAASVVVDSSSLHVGSGGTIAAAADTTHGALQFLATGGSYPMDWKADVRTVEVTNS